MSDKKRRLPRHVDGRIMVGYMPIKNFFIFLPIAIIIIVGAFLIIKQVKADFIPFILFITTVLVGAIAYLFCEFNQRETGYDVIKSYLKYKREGNLHYERSTVNVPISERCVRNKIKRKSDIFSFNNENTK